MKIEDATKVKEKLDDILLAVDEYGKQSEQCALPAKMDTKKLQKTK